MTAINVLRARVMRTCLDALAYLAIVGMAVWFTTSVVYTVAEHRPIVTDSRGSVGVENTLLLSALALGMLGLFGLTEFVVGTVWPSVACTFSDICMGR